MTVYRCEDSLEGIFTAIYLAYEERRDHGDTYLALHDEPMLFAEDVQVLPDWEKTRKVMNTLNRRFGEKDYLSLCMALASEDEEKAQAVYRTVVEGLKKKVGEGHLFDDLADDNVSKAFALARNASREIDHLKGFARFQELENGVLYSRIGPKNNILTFLMPHFSDRLPIENFVLCDDRRNLFGIHPAGKQWVLFRGEAQGLSETEDSGNRGSEAGGSGNRGSGVRTLEGGSLKLKFSAQELQYQELFRDFCHAITIDGRRNAQLQRNMLPLRFREYMVEFQSAAAMPAAGLRT